MRVFLQENTASATSMYRSFMHMGFNVARSIVALARRISGRVQRLSNCLARPGCGRTSASCSIGKQKRKSYGQK